MWQVNELMWNISMHASTKSTLRSWKRSSARKGKTAYHPGLERYDFNR
jgi:hypothetical protein